MRKLLAPIALILVAVFIVGSVSLAGAQAEGDETLVAVSQTLRFKFIDLGRPGDSPGDFFVEKDALWNEDQTERIGTNWVKCTLDFGTAAICIAAVNVFNRGQLTGTGAVSGAESFLFPVTGGTGDFQHVTGEVRVTFLDEETARFEFDLSGVAA
jgi:hypothetical protein